MRKITIVVKTTPPLNLKLLKELFFFVKRLASNTEHIKIILVMTIFEEEYLDDLPEQTCLLPMDYLNRKDAIEFL